MLADGEYCHLELLASFTSDRLGMLITICCWHCRMSHPKDGTEMTSLQRKMTLFVSAVEHTDEELLKVVHSTIRKTASFQYFGKITQKEMTPACEASWCSMLFNIGLFQLFQQESPFYKQKTIRQLHMRR